MEYKDKIITAVAEKACEQVAIAVIKVLRADKESRLSGDDSGLQNVWDENVFKFAANHLYIGMITWIPLSVSLRPKPVTLIKAKLKPYGYRLITAKIGIEIINLKKKPIL